MEIKKAILFIDNKLKNSNIKWYLIGKTNLYLQGIDLKPTKVGILIHSEDLDNFLKTFKDYIVSDIEELDNGEAKEFYLNILDTRDRKKIG